MNEKSLRGFGVVQTAKEEGFGGEGASIAEAFHALSLGIRPEDVVFDSPCKTKVIMVDVMIVNSHRFGNWHHCTLPVNTSYTTVMLGGRGSSPTKINDKSSM